MKFIRWVLPVLTIVWLSPAFAQAPVLPSYRNATGSGTTEVSVANPLPVSGSFSASSFTATSTGTPISVTTGGVTGTLPTGAVVVATNVGTTNGAYCALGASATTSSQYIAPNGGWFAFTVGASTQLTCITSTSTTTVNMTGGAGLPAGTGGGGGGSGGAVTIASSGVASGAYVSGSILSGALAQGAVVDITNGTDTAYAGSGSTSLDGYMKGLYNGVTSAIPAGTNLIGKVGIDQTTAGTTNGIAIVGVNAATALAGSGSVGTGTLRIAVGIDSATAAGTAPVTGGIPVVNGASTYNTIAASQTAQALTGGSGGATGDYLSQCTIVPATTAPGVVTIYDNSTSIYAYPGGGTTALTTLVPFTIPVGAVSVSGAWKVTTGANVSVVCVGKFH